VARGKHLSLEEARKDGKLAQFAKEHPSKGDWERFNKLFEAMAHGESPSPRRQTKASQTSSRDDDAC
jgi:hypothetical protein